MFGFRVNFNPSVQFIKKGWEEIDSSPRLILYGFFLSLIHTVTFYHWHENSWSKTVAAGAEPICQPFFQSCGKFMILSHAQLDLVLGFYLFYSLFTAALFLLIFLSKVDLLQIPAQTHSRSFVARVSSLASSLASSLVLSRRFSTHHAMSHLFLLSLLKFSMFSMSFLLMGNYHYMPLIITILYIFWPAKRMVIPPMICSFYFAAGFLKLNHEWLSGNAVAPTTVDFLPHGLFLALCAFVVGMEIILVWGLLSRERIIRTSTLIVLLGFHIFSWQIVGYFYPVVMFMLLSWFILPELCDALSPRRVCDAAISGAGANVRRNHMPTLNKNNWLLFGPMVVFFLLQLVPLGFKGDSALTGEGRSFALNMFDARAQCRSLVVAHYKNNTSKELTHSFQDLGARVKCDPYMYFNMAKNLCNKLRADPQFADLDLYFQNKRTTDPEFKMRVSQKAFCEADHHYSVLSANSWILK